MQGRTFFRTMFENLFVNNAFCKALAALVNFCNEQCYYGKKELKFLKKMPYNRVGKSNASYPNKFVFRATEIHGANLR